MGSATEFRRNASAPNGYKSAANTALIPEIWSKEDYKFAFAADPLMPFTGMSDTSIIQVNRDFQANKGSKITFGLRGIDNSDGQGNDGVYEGNEVGMTFYDDSVELAERGNSWLIAGNNTEQSAYTDLRSKNRDTAREWVGRVQGADKIAALSGLPTMALAGKRTGVRAVDASSEYIETVNYVSSDGAAVDKSATALRHFCGGQTKAGVVFRVSGDAAITSDSNCLFGTQVIEHVKRMAFDDIDDSGNFISPLRPVMVNGEPYYLLFISRLQEKALRGETAWLNAVQNAGVRGSENILFKGVDYIWNNVLVKVTDLVHERYGENGTTASESFEKSTTNFAIDICASGITVHRAMFCGAQAACCAWGKQPTWTDGFRDWQNTKFGTHTNMIYGTKKSVFATGASGADVAFGCILIDTAVALDG